LAQPVQKPSPPKGCAYSIAEVFDPLSKSEVDQVNGKLLASAAGIKLEIPALDQSELLPNPPAQGLSSSEESPPGLVYRVATPVVIRTVSNTPPNLPTLDKSNCTAASPLIAQSVTAIVPDSRSRFLLSSEAGAFTTTNLTFGFSNGMLTDYTVQRPSELAAVAGIPLRIANDIIQIPANLLQLRVNYDTQATALVNAQTALKQAQIQQATSLKSAQTALVNAQTALLQARINQPTAVANAQAALVQAQVALQKAIEAAAATGQTTAP
jgi:hypothetical protein